MLRVLRCFNSKRSDAPDNKQKQCRDAQRSNRHEEGLANSRSSSRQDEEKLHYTGNGPTNRQVEYEAMHLTLHFCAGFRLPGSRLLYAALS
jgi:hypothetical protein